MIKNIYESNTYSFSELLRLTQGVEDKSYRDYASQNIEGIIKGIQRLAELFRQCIEKDILNDDTLFFRLEQQRIQWSENYSFEINLEQARKKYKLAWEKRFFDQVVEILSPFQNYLNPSELKKLEYAKKILHT